MRSTANGNAGSRHIKGSWRTLVDINSKFAHRSQLNGESHFHNDLGLDSLDTVEVVMAIEEVCYSSNKTHAEYHLTVM